jgi:multidrug resistance efflux pump
MATTKKQVETNDLAAIYADDTDYQQLQDKIDGDLSWWNGKRDNYERTLAGLRELIAANREKLQLATGVLSGPNQFGASSRARMDKSEAESMIRRCEEEIASLTPAYQRAISGAEEAEKKKREFPMDKLRAQRKLELLRAKCGSAIKNRW